MHGERLDDQPDVLSGWKEIAAHLKKSVRTAQRWESELGLPVRRMTTPDGGQIIFAHRAEIDSWRQRNGSRICTEQDQPSAGDVPLAAADAFPFDDASDPSRHAADRATNPRSALWRMAVAAITVLAAGEALFIAWSLWPAPQAPVQFELLGRDVRALTGNGREVWAYSLGRPVFAPSGMRTRNGLRVDLDGDGRDEVLVAVSFGAQGATIEESDAVLAFSDGGRLLWTVKPDLQLSDGRQQFDAPWRVGAMAVAGHPSARVWIAYAHHTWWPGVVVEVTPDGRESIRYVQSGRIHTLAYWPSSTGSYLVAGGTMREYARASVAFVKTDELPAHSPGSADEQLTCATCPEGQPEALVLLPQLEVTNALNRPFGWVNRLVVHEERVVVSTDAGFGEGSVVAIGPDLRVVDFEQADRYWQAHLNLEREGRLSHSADRCPDLLNAHEIRAWTDVDGWSTYRVTPKIRPPGTSVSNEQASR